MRSGDRVKILSMNGKRIPHGKYGTILKGCGKKPEIGKIYLVQVEDPNGKTFNTYFIESELQKVAKVKKIDGGGETSPPKHPSLALITIQDGMVVTTFL